MTAPDIPAGMRPVDPVRPVAPWLGGKRNLASRIVALIERVPHAVYAEPFVGRSAPGHRSGGPMSARSARSARIGPGGGIFLRRRLRPRAEVINDFGRDIATLFRILQRHYPQFLEVMRFQLTTRAEFERLVATDPATLTDLERAARFLYLQRTAFGGKVSGRNFGVSRDRPARFNLTTLESMLEDVHARLAGVTIECLDFAEFIRRYDGADTLFYLDPPYWGSEGDYGKALFSRDDFARLAESLAAIRGRFLMSINDTPEIRGIFGRFDLTEVRTTYSVGNRSGGGGERAELIVAN